MAAKELFLTTLFNDANLVAYYRLSTGALTTDSKGSNTLTNGGTVAESASGVFDYCADFGTTNTTKYLTVANNLGIAGNGDITVSLWVKLNTEIADGATWVFFLHSSTTTQNKYFQLFYQRTGSTYTIYYDGGGSAVSQTGALGTASWNHFVLTRTGGNVYAYKNGSAVGNAAVGTSGVGYDRFTFGAQEATPITPTSALIDDVAVFNRALTATEILNLYNGNIPLRPMDSFFAFF